jgi:predicted O-methyltransferase YrrM
MLSNVTARRGELLRTRANALPHRHARLQRRLSRSLNRVARKASDAGEVFDAASAIAEGDLSISPSQLRGEMVAFMSHVQREQPRRVLEIGTYKGGTLYLLAWASAPNARLLSLDIPGLRTFAHGRQHVDAWRVDSSATQTRDAVHAFFGHDPVDLLFIDGGHAYEAVTRDFELYAPLIRPGGRIAFHDIVDGPSHLVGQVPRFWQEVKPSLTDVVELVDSWAQGGYGIGLGRKPTCVPGSGASG